MLHEGTVNGFVQCRSPDIVVGYSKESFNAIGVNDDSFDCKQESSNVTMLHVHATTEPFTVIPNKSSRFSTPFCMTECIESDDTMARVEQLCQQMNINEDHGLILTTSRGVSCLASRFLLEQEPPPGLNTFSSCAHFVSLIPIRQLQSSRIKGMVLTTQQVLNNQQGSQPEHAIVLMNFFLYLSKKKKNSVNFGDDVYLAFGFSLPEGRTVSAGLILKCFSYFLAHSNNSTSPDCCSWQGLGHTAMQQNRKGTVLGRKLRLFILATK